MSPLTAACRRLDAAVARLESGFAHLETAVSQKFDRDEAEIAKLRAEVAKAEAAYADALALKKKTAKDFLQVCKLARSDLGEHAVLQIKAAIDMASPEGEAKQRAKLAATIEVARWMRSPSISRPSLANCPAVNGRIGALTCRLNKVSVWFVMRVTRPVIQFDIRDLRQLIGK